jgi:hypothetical protein
MVLGNLGYVLHLIGEQETARTYTLKSLRLGRQKTLDGQRDDAQKHRVEPQDTQYEEMLNELWLSLTPLLTDAS